MSQVRVTCELVKATMETKDQKKHRKKNSGPKAEKKKKRHLQDLQLGDEEDARKRNPKALLSSLLCGWQDPFTGLRI